MGLVSWGAGFARLITGAVDRAFGGSIGNWRGKSCCDCNASDGSIMGVATRALSVIEGTAMPNARFKEVAVTSGRL